jgi:hypothetical protein
VTGTPLGTAHPLLVQDVASDGRWVAACQPRADTDGDGKVQVWVGRHGEVSGDELKLYLMTAANPEGLPVDELVAASPEGRWVVYMSEGALILHDIAEGMTIDLQGATQVRGRSPVLSHGGADFDDRGEHVAYIRKSPEGDRVVVRTLSSGKESTFDAGPGLIWRVMFAGSGEWLAVAVISKDTDGNTLLDYPEQITSLAGGSCRGPAMSFSTSGYEGDAWQWRTFRIKDQFEETREVLARASDGLLVRTDDGSLAWRRASGSEVSLVPADCAANVLGLYDTVPSVLVACDVGTEQGPLRIYHPDMVYELGITDWVNRPVSIVDSIRIQEVVDGSNRSSLVDLATGQLHSRAYKGEQGINQDTAVVLETTREGVTRFRDLSTGSVETVAENGNRHIRAQQFGRFSAVQSKDLRSQEQDMLLVDLVTRKIVGTLPSVPVAVREDGAVLLAEEIEYRVFQGPLHWVTAQVQD